MNKTIKEIKEIIESAQKLSILSLNKFYLKMGIDPNIMKEVYRPVEFGVTDNKEVAYYDSIEDIIILKDKTIKFIKDELAKAKDKNEVKNKLIKNIARTIVHETIHSGRTIIKRENTIDRELLINLKTNMMLHNEYVLDRTPRRIVACYEIHDDTTEKLEELINTNDKNNLAKKIDEYESRITGQEGLEEVLTEALAWMVIDNYYWNDLPLDKLENMLILNPNARTDVLIGSKILMSLDDEIIRWFLTTRLNNNYVEMLKNEFLEDYDDLLYYLGITYKKTSSQDYTKEEEQTLMPKIDNIIKRKMSRDKIKSNSTEIKK